MSNKTINQALRDLFIGLGGDISALADNTSVSDYIEDLESAIKGAKVIVEPMISSEKVFDSNVNDLQTGVSITNDNAILGSLKYLSSGALVERWGAGNFIALRFIIKDSSIKPENIKVSHSGGGLVTLDADLNGAFKIGDEITDTFIVEVTSGDEVITYEYDLTKLNIAD